jgi:PAS domain S-box-containing protein
MTPASVILIVDDDRFGRKSLDAALAGQGYHVVLAESGPDALAKAAECRPDLILLDVMMPGMDGFETLRRLRANPDLAEVPVIFVTALDDRDARLTGFEAGADDFLTKPIDRGEVRARARTITRLNRYRRLLEERGRFQRLFEFSPDGILIVNTAGVILQANPAAERLLAEGAGSIAGRSLAEWFPGDRDALADCLHICQQPDAGPARLELPLAGRAAPTWVELQAGSFPQENEPAAQVVLRDITARRRAEEQIRHQAALLDLAPNAIVVEDAAGRIAFWNQGAEKTYGWQREEVLGRPVHEVVQAAPPTRNEAGLRKDEFRQLRKDGSAIVVQHRESVAPGETGQACARLVVNTDVTEQKQMERRYLRAQRMEGLGALAGGIAHDLNNVLTPLAMGLPMLARRLPEGDSGRNMAQTLESCVERGASMVKQILTFVRGQEGERKSIDLGPMLRELGKLVAYTLPETVSIQVEVARDLWAVVGDVTQVYQAPMNLLLNARDAMPRGGSLTLVAENLPAGPGLDNAVRVRVRDTGTGMPPDVAARIFEPFFTTKEPGKGTGLGLATVREIIKAHAGSIEFTSEVGVGTEFRVTLPAAGQQAPAPAAAGRSDLPGGNGETVLVVDDERSVRELARAILETYGYRTVLAADAGAALAACREGHDLKVALIDYYLPDMNGFAMCRELRELCPAVRPVLTSGNALTPEQLADADLPADAFVSKPFTASQLLKAVKSRLTDAAVPVLSPPLTTSLTASS